MLTETLLVIEPAPDRPRNSEGSVLRLRDGRLALVYSRFHGGTADNAGAEIAFRTSSDDGLSWSGDRTLISGEGQENVMSVSLLRRPEGDILLGYLVKNSWGDCRYYIRRSWNELATLSPRICVTEAPGYYVVNNDRLLQLSSGRLIVPTALHPCPSGNRQDWDSRGIAMAFVSDDGGQSWQRSVSTLSLPDSGSGLQEPGVAELNDGRLWMWMRTDRGVQYQAFSEDKGLRWGAPEPSRIASPLSPASVKRLPWNDALLMVWNDHSGRHAYPPGKRTPLCAALSHDDGVRWTPSTILEGDADGWYCYVSITPDGEHNAILSYCAGDSRVGGLNRLKLVRIRNLS